MQETQARGRDARRVEKDYQRKQYRGDVRDQKFPSHEIEEMKKERRKHLSSCDREGNKSMRRGIE